MFSLNLAKASSSISRGVFLTEAPNVGKSPTRGNRRSTFRLRNLLQQASTLKQTVLISTLLLHLKISAFPFLFLPVLGAMSTGKSASVDQWLPLRNKSEDSVLASSVFLPGSVVKLQQKENQSKRTVLNEFLTPVTVITFIATIVFLGVARPN